MYQIKIYNTWSTSNVRGKLGPQIPRRSTRVHSQNSLCQNIFIKEGGFTKKQVEFRVPKYLQEVTIFDITLYASKAHRPSYRNHSGSSKIW